MGRDDDGLGEVGLVALRRFCGAPDRGRVFRWGRVRVLECVEDFGERVSPGPTRRQPQGELAGAVDEAAGECEESGSDRARNDQAVGVVTAESSRPTHHVVSEDRDLEPCRVRREHPGGEVLESGAGLQVFDANSMVACSRWNRSTATTSPVRPVRNAWCRQSGHSFCWALSVKRVRENQLPSGHSFGALAGGVVAFGDLGLAVFGVFDRLPGVIGDARNRGVDRADTGSDRHRVTDVEDC